MQQFQIALILVLCSLYCSYVAADGCTDDGYYVVEDDCNSYYQCVDQLRHDFKCPEGLKFDTAKFVCTWPDEANCKNSGEKQTTWKPDTSKKPSEPTADCPSGDGYFADEENTARFYACAEGTRHYYDCPDTLKYDVGTNTCG